MQNGKLGSSLRFFAVTSLGRLCIQLVRLVICFLIFCLLLKSTSGDPLNYWCNTNVHRGLTTADIARWGDHFNPQSGEWANQLNLFFNRIDSTPCLSQFYIINLLFFCTTVINHTSVHVTKASMLTTHLAAHYRQKMPASKTQLWANSSLFS